MSETTTGSNPTAKPSTAGRNTAWSGMTLAELQRARAKALVRREVGRSQMQQQVDGMKSNVESNGIRALMFSPTEVTRLKTADYVLLGVKLSRFLLNLRAKRRRKR